MNLNLRQLYKPIQPTISQTAEDVSYREFMPHTQLQSYIYCYWQLKTNHPLTTPFNYTVVADGCIDIFFELTRPDENFVMGFCKKYTAFPLGQSFNYVGVRFLPTMFVQLFKVDAAQLSNKFERLKEVLPQVSNYIRDYFDEPVPHRRRRSGSLKTETIIEKLDHYFLGAIQNAEPDFDNRLYDALNIILTNYGVVNVESELNTGISPRQLRRIFNYYIGTTAKTFSKVVRFQNILLAKPSTQSLKQNKLFYDVGFYDQAHFIKDFKNFYGVTPNQAFRRSS